MTESKPPRTPPANADPFAGLPIPPPKPPYTIPENCDFLTVRETFMDNECSPVINHTFKGFLINMPKEHYYEPGEKMLSGAFTLVPVCGAYRIANGDFPELSPEETLEHDISDDILVVAVDTKTREVYTGHYVEPWGKARMPEAFRRDVLEGMYESRKNPPAPPGTMISGGYFNYNLPAVVRLPEKPAEYIVYVVVGPYKSNVRTVKIMKKK